jgi:hypothetical protein
MKLALGLVLALSAVALPAQAQLPPGSYQRQCRDISLQGQFLHARCPSSRGGWANSSINVASCSTGIGVDYEGGLICGGPGNPNPGPPDYSPPGGGRPPPPPGYGPGYDRYSITVFDRPGYRGRSMRVDGEIANLDRTGFNDRIASIKLRKRSGPWLACENANFRGRCVTIDGDTRDLGRLGMLNSVSSLRPLG